MTQLSNWIQSDGGRVDEQIDKFSGSQVNTTESALKSWVGVRWRQKE